MKNKEIREAAMFATVLVWILFVLPALFFEVYKPTEINLAIGLAAIASPILYYGIIFLLNFLWKK